MYAYHPTEDPMIEVTGRPMETLPVQTFLSDPETYLNEVQFRSGGYVLTRGTSRTEVGYLVADFPLPDSIASNPPKNNRDHGTRIGDSMEGAGA